MNDKCAARPARTRARHIPKHTPGWCIFRKYSSLTDFKLRATPPADPRIVDFADLIDREVIPRELDIYICILMLARVSDRHAFGSPRFCAARIHTATELSDDINISRARFIMPILAERQ